MIPALPTLPRPWRVLVGLGLALLLLAGCSMGQGDSSAVDGAAAVQEPGEQDEAADGGAGAAPEEAGAGGEVGVTGSGVLAGTQGRRVVTAGIDLAVTDVPAAAQQVRDIAVAADGEVHEERSTGGDRPRAEIVVRVPVEATGDLLGAVTRLGQELNRTTTTEPAEDRLVDLESRTATQRAGVARIRALLEQASTLEDVLALEAELTRRQADLESVDAQRAALADRAALATVTVVLTPAQDVVVAAEPRTPFLAGLVAGWQALVSSTAVVLVAMGALLPFAVVVAVVLALVLVARRWRRRTHPRTVAAAPAP